jgi:hypothetical protein
MGPTVPYPNVVHTNLSSSFHSPNPTDGKLQYSSPSELAAPPPPTVSTPPKLLHQRARRPSSFPGKVCLPRSSRRGHRQRAARRARRPCLSRDEAPAPSLAAAPPRLLLQRARHPAPHPATAPDPPRERARFFTVNLRLTPPPVSMLLASCCRHWSYRRRGGTVEEKIAKEAWAAGTGIFFCCFLLLIIVVNILVICCKDIFDMEFFY